MKVYKKLDIKLSKSQEKLLEIYKKDKQKARVLYFSNSASHYYSPESELIEEKRGNLKIVSISKVIGISVNSKMYSHLRIGRAFYFSSKGVYIKQYNQHVRPLNVKEFITFFGLKFGSEVHRQAIIDCYPWIEWLFYLDTTVLSKNSMSIIMKNKISNATDYLKLVYGENKKLSYQLLNNGIPPKRWKKYRRFAVGQDFSVIPKNFSDCLSMAFQLGKTVNLNWSERRWKEEHDLMAKEITSILYQAENRDLKIAKPYLEISEKTGYRLLRTSAELAVEGMLKKHCVASYSNSVDSGRCAIFNIDGYTAEITINSDGIPKLNQLKGEYNSSAPTHLRKSIENQLGGLKFDVKKEVEKKYNFEDAMVYFNNND